MKFSLNWLKDFVDIDISAEELAEKLTNAGFEVESIEYLGAELKNIIAGKIEKIEKHPNADKLVITQVSDGKNMHQIVTGADNVFEGAVVPASLPGAVLAGGFEIKEAKLRGVPSFGMLCSEKELGIADEAQGIWILPENTPIGVDVVEHFHIRDIILDVAILPNRGDAQSIIGLAREIAIVLEKEFKLPEAKLNEQEAADKIDVEVAAPELCPKYTARIIKNIEIKASPMWMQMRLKACGIRPINNIVDITNYILLEYGQPLHAFDRAYLDGNKIIVRTAKVGEKLKTLDEVERTLKENHLLICDTKKPVALGGVMGGQNSEIKENTKDVLLEAAFFDPGNIRMAELDLDLRTESSIRFEKGIDFDQVEKASARAAYLMQELANGQVQKGIFSKINHDSYFFKEEKIAFSVDKINELLGTDFSTEEMLAPLKKLGFVFNEDNSIIYVPSWRKNDITELPCLAEEIARLLGLDRITSKLPDNAVVVKARTKLEKLIEITAEIMQDAGFSEVKTFPMIAPEDLVKMQLPDTSLKMINALSQAESVMRPHILPSILKTLEYNYKRQEKDLKFFEIGKCFSAHGYEVQEELVLGAVITGEVNPYKFEQKEKADNEVDFRYLKNLLANIHDQFGIEDINYDKKEYPHLNPAQSLIILAGDVKIGEFGFLHPEIGGKYDIDTKIGYVQMNLSAIAEIKAKKVKYKPFSKFPHIRRDIAMLVPKNVSYLEINETIAKIKPNLVQDYYLFDYFESEKIGKDKKSLAFCFIYQNQNKTLTDQNVNPVHDKFIKQLKNSLPIEIR
ncbi:phenylalanine--tRNA ligase subunit beta [Candidatus Margulisiibacteriota bacterium]